ncbi:RdgB/HAM1 family non-canonical purine NTP pyrophosphatase [Catenovulum sediminis]|uniref:RdgB/HAM1 family non-canonical purine NTP pyrophosphatase n=1 Tax=Catenovulum sediminis TaxID=1740262 RepID=UPI001FE39559|nr:RdgB/HAM1 family non-canonical purine NTP pyrophosphatase [Catenovulum sediminis]
MMKKIVLATGNLGKVAELNQMLSDKHYEVVSQGEFNVPEADETGLTFVENAILKARNACHHTGLPAIADDSGLEVDFLHGLPGIYSARYAGLDATDQDNIDKLQAALKGVPAIQRTAKFQCVLVFMRHEKDPTPLICHGTWHGQITETQSGSNGFGYDPVFFVKSENCTSAELNKERKNTLSHRAQALKLLAREIDKLA